MGTGISRRSVGILIEQCGSKRAQESRVSRLLGPSCVRKEGRKERGRDKILDGLPALDLFSNPSLGS